MARTNTGVTTRQDALALIEQAKQVPEIVNAFNNAAHPAHAQVREYYNRAMYWAHEHPQTPDGQPVPVAEVAKDRARADYYDPLSELDGLTPEQARERLSAMQGNDEFRAFLDNPNHPEHYDAKEGMRRLDILSRGGAPDWGADGARPYNPHGDLDSLSPEAARARIEELQGDASFRETYLDNTAALAPQAQETMRRLHVIAGGADRDWSAPGATGDGGVSDEATALADRAYEAQEALDWYRTGLFLDENHPIRDPGHPDHARAVAERDTMFQKAHAGELTYADVGLVPAVPGEVPGNLGDNPPGDGLMDALESSTPNAPVNDDVVPSDAQGAYQSGDMNPGSSAGVGFNAGRGTITWDDGGASAIGPGSNGD